MYYLYANLMEMIRYKRVTKTLELEQILALQKENFKSSLSHDEIQKEGFVTVAHSLDVLKKMNDKCAHIIAKDDDFVVGYALVMLKEFKDEISVLTAMFETAQKLLGDQRYVAMGQICISKNYRRKGIFKGLYNFYKKELNHEFDCLLTEVATNNIRSLNAHKSVGFEVLKTQISDDISWELICWNWR